MAKITIRVNEELKEIEAGTTLQQLYELIGAARRGGMAMAVNEAVVRRGEWVRWELKDGDKVLIITAAQWG